MSPGLSIRQKGMLQSLGYLSDQGLTQIPNPQQRGPRPSSSLTTAGADSDHEKRNIEPKHRKSGGHKIGECHYRAVLKGRKGGNGPWFLLKRTSMLLGEPFV